MNRINTLVAEIKGQVSDALKSRIEKLKELEAKLDAAKTLNETEPSETNQETIDDLNELIIDFVEDLEAQLQAIIESEKETPPATPPETPPTTEPKKSGNGVGWLLAGLLVTVVTLGAVTTFKKR